MRVDERKSKEGHENESQPGDGEEHEGRKDRGVMGVGPLKNLCLSVVDIKRFGHETFVNVVHCSSMTNRVYCFPAAQGRDVLLATNGEVYVYGVERRVEF